MSKGICIKTGKHRHASKGAAEAALRALLKAPYVEDRDLLCTFICSAGRDSCGDWHVGRNEFKAPVEVIPVMPKMRRSGGLRYKKEKPV